VIQQKLVAVANETACLEMFGNTTTEENGQTHIVGSIKTTVARSTATLM
jgi:hypothetical protein